VWADDPPTAARRPRAEGSGKGNGNGSGPPPANGRRPAPAGRRRRRNRTPKQKVLLGLGVFTVFALLVLAGGLAYYWHKLNSLDRVDVSLSAAAANQPENFLLVGSDTRDISRDTPDAGGIFGKGNSEQFSGQRADTIVIARVDPKKTSIELLSIPRDLLVTKPNSTSRTKINSTYNSGPQALIDTIRDNLGVDINHYVEVNFQSFKGLVEAIGGVPMYFDRAMYDKNTGLSIRKAGCYNLTPVQALAFARSRHLFYSNGSRWVSDGTADLGRITRQQVFLRHALAKISTLGITNLGTINSLVNVAVDNVKVDSALSTTQMISLARKFEKFDSKDLATHQLPTVASGANLILDSNGAQPVLDIFRGKAPATNRSAAPTTTIPNAAVTVSVMNGTGKAGLAKQAGDQLTAISFNLGTVDNATPTTASTIYYARSNKAAAEAVASHVSPSPTLVVDPSLSGTNVRLVLGSDYREVVARSASSSATSTTTPASVGTSATATNSESTGKPIGYTTGDPPPGVPCG
jgi:polyisoprenyl-teichoic acid--peptidoglycan teichoic acid transferase